MGSGVFSIDVRPDGSSAVLVVHGDLDLASSPQLADRAETTGSRDLVIDLSDVTFMDSTGLRALWTLRQNMASAGGRALLRSPSAAVMRVLKTTKLDKVFDYADSDSPV